MRGLTVAVITVLTVLRFFHSFLMIFFFLSFFVRMCHFFITYVELLGAKFRANFKNAAARGS